MHGTERVTRVLRCGIVMVALLAVTACSESGSDATEPQPGGDTALSFVGTLAGDGVSGELEVTVAAGSAAAAVRAPLFAVSGTMAIVSVSGCLYLGGGCVAVTGTYNTDSRSFSVSGGGFTFTGTFSNGTIAGTFAGPGSAGQFVAHSDPQGTGQSFCGTYTGDSDGIWNLVRRGTRVVGVYNDAGGDTGQLTGTANGNGITLSFTGGSATGTVSGNAVSGSWQTVDGDAGTWTGTLRGCRG